MQEQMLRLLDEQAIRDLTARYSDAVTHLDAARAASVYADDGVVAILGHETCGRAAIEEGMRASFAAFEILQLVAHGGVIELSGTSATARWSTVELTVKRGAAQFGVIFGRYDDTLVRMPEGWRFARRDFTMAGRMQLPIDKLQTFPAFFASGSAS